MSSQKEVRKEYERTTLNPCFEDIYPFASSFFQSPISDLDATSGFAFQIFKLKSIKDNARYHMTFKRQADHDVPAVTGVPAGSQEGVF